VPADEPLSETVVFELLHPLGAERLCERLRHRWFVEVDEGKGVSLVAVRLRPREDDLAVLLRAVKIWAADSALPALTFHVDGRAYVLWSGTAIARSAAAA
jgi:hypothetical protein